MDANFRLRLRKNKTKRSDDDPELGSGWGCLVEENGYQLLVKMHADDKDVSAQTQTLPAADHLKDVIPTCGTEFHAVNAANTRGGREGLSVSGIGGVKCGRHNFILRMADLQRGER
jgi:hypothetical protein